MFEGLPSFLQKAAPYVQAAATFCIAAAAFYIGREQQKTNETRLRNKLYDRRYQIYELVDTSLREFTVNSELTKNTTLDILTAYRKSQFDCPNEKDYIHTIMKRMLKTKSLREKISDAIEKKKKLGDLPKEEEEELNWLIEQRPELVRRFEKYLSFPT